MSRNYDNWERLLKVVLRREDDRRLAYASSSSYSSVTESDSENISDDENFIARSVAFRKLLVAWQKGNVIGRGPYGYLYEGLLDGGLFVAVKEISLLDEGDEGKMGILQLEQEIALLSQFKHENIVQYYGTEKSESHLYMFSQLVGKGSLQMLYQKYNLPDMAVSAYTRQILHGLKYLHYNNVTHRDIKCSNILVDVDGSVKLSGFGFAALAKALKLNDMEACKGTAFSMAPEVVRSLGYGLAADIWSLGCTVLEMLTRRFPYSNMEPMSVLNRIGRGELPPIPDTLSSDARDFILKCLQVDASARPTASELLDHPFAKGPPLSSSNHGFENQIGQANSTEKIGNRLKNYSFEYQTGQVDSTGKIGNRPKNGFGINLSSKKWTINWENFRLNRMVKNFWLNNNINRRLNRQPAEPFDS